MQNRDSAKVYTLAGLLYEYQRLDRSQNRITVSNDKYYDRYINGVWQDPYYL